MIRRRKIFSLLMLSALVLGACSKKAPLPGEQLAEQHVAAKVNGFNIAEHRIHAVLSPSSEAKPLERSLAAKRQVLEDLIDQELLAQKARDAELDRDPLVIEAIHSVTHKILAQAYLGQTLLGSELSPEETHRFYNEHPELFAQRRLYRYHELTPILSGDTLGSLKAEAARATHLDTISQWLTARHMPYTLATLTKPAEKVPLEILPHLATMKDNQVVVLVVAGKVMVIQLLHYQSAPLSEQEASPLIQKFLGNRKRIEIIKAETQRLREQAHIEYLGVFSTTGGDHDVASDPVSPAPSPKKIQPYASNRLLGRL